METELQDVGTESVGAAESTATDSSPVEQTAGESQGGVNATAEAQTSTQQGQEAEIDPLQDVPTVEELTRLAEQKTPYAAALARLRPAYEGLKTKLEEYQPLDPWKTVATTIGDPALAQSAHELVSAIHTPVSLEERSEFPSGFTTRPFLDKIDSESPGTARQIFSDLLRYPDVDPSGRESTVVREFLRDLGLDPDKMKEYREIDTLRASSGVVTAADLAVIPEKYHDAFKSMSAAARDEILDLMRDKEDGGDPALAEEYLRNGDRALRAERWEQEQKDREARALEQQETELRERIESTVQSDITAEIRSLSDSIHQSLSALTFSSDPAIDKLQKLNILSTIATLQSPAYRFLAEDALKAVGASLDGFDELANRWAERRSAYKTFEAMGDKWQANRALSESTLARQQLLVRLNDYAMRLAKAGGDRAAAAAGQVETALSAASGRFVPTGNGNGQQGFQNPYEQNPHPFGSPEYYKFIKDLDRQYKVTNGSMFG